MTTSLNEEHGKGFTMTVTDRMRTDLHGCLDGLMGREMADIMMELLPPVGWGEVVRRQDVAAMRSDLHSEIVGLRVELKIEIAELRAEIADVRTELNAEIAEVRAEIADVRTELKAEIAEVRAEVAELRTEVRLLAGQVQSLTNDIKRLSRAMTALTGGVLTVGVMVITMLFQVS